MVWEMWNRWDLVVANIAIFALFLLLMPFRRGGGWRARGAFIAFLIALFTEMYGLPLTVYLIMPFILSDTGLNEWLWSGHLFGWLGIVIGTPILFIGAVLIIEGWRMIHREVSRRGGLVTEGIYSVMRHPQYLGLMFFTLGWLIHWPTIIGAAMWPLLALLYYRLARIEDRDLEERFGEEYRRYREAVPMFSPKPIKAMLAKRQPT